ncbi:MAG: peptidylprolyl isomerase, partial [Magnetococcales bacterium]|nr:peptidylprolyl isomerase [Magnetococcales bacterium]
AAEKKTEKADKAPVDSSSILATMGGVNLSLNEFQNLLNYSDREVKAQLLANPEILNQKIAEAMLRRYVIAKAREQKLEQKGEVAFQMDRAKESVLVEHYLKNASKITGKFPEEADLQKAYEENKSRFMMPAAVHIAQIFFKFEPNMDEKARGEVVKQAERYVTMLQRKEADFPSLASKYSQHPQSAAQGGDMGWVPTAQLLPEFKKALEGVKNNDVSNPVKSAQGVHIIQNLGSREASARPYDQVKAMLAQMLKEKKMQENKDAYIQELVKKQPISLNESSRVLLK